MKDGFAEMITTASNFLGELAQNNERGWFEDRKAQFKSDIEAPLKMLANLFAEDLSRLTGISHTGKVGRIYRDVRFSKDKSPYNTYVHAYWMQAKDNAPGWLLHIDTTGAKLLTGLHDMSADGLTSYRAAVDRDGEALKAAIDGARVGGAELIDFGDTALKRVPKPFEPDHPQGDFLRRKQIALGVQFNGDSFSQPLIPAMSNVVATLLPFWHWCGNALK